MEAGHGVLLIVAPGAFSGKWERVSVRKCDHARLRISSRSPQHASAQFSGMAAPMRQDAAPDQRPRYSAGRLSGMLQCHKMAAIDARKALRGRANLQEPNCS